MHSRDPLKIKTFEIISNDDENKSISLSGEGLPILEYRESIFMPFVEITARIIDTGNTVPVDNGKATVGLLEGGFGQGTETIKFHIEDEFGNQINLTDEDDLRVDYVGNEDQTFANSSYTMTIVSKEAYNNTLVSNRCNSNALYSGKIHEVVVAILKHNLKTPKWNKSFIDKTINEYHGRGMDRNPFEMILDLQSIAIPEMQINGESAKGKSSGYLFWQTSGGYNFRSVDQMFKTEGVFPEIKDSTGRKILNFVENSETGEDLPEGYDGKIIKSKIPMSISGLKNFEDGAYSTQIETFNNVSKEYDVLKLSAKGDGNSVIAGRALPKINPDFCDEEGNPFPTARKRTRVPVGQTVVGGDNLKLQVEKTEKEAYNVKETIQQSHQNFRQKLTTSLTIVIDANLGLRAGDLIYCEFPSLTSRKLNLGSRTRKSGIYMIADLCHYGDVTSAFTGLNLVRDSFGTKLDGD